MGTWGVGVFENDAAEDFLDNLSSMDPEGRERFLVYVLTSAEEGKDSTSRPANPSEALAAIALVAIEIARDSAFSGGEGHPGVEDWICMESLHEIRGISLRALDSIESNYDWHWNSWIDEKEKEEALVDVVKMRRILSAF
ncbi:DUF4259 domain-containing protein [Nocardiopsis sp. YSL2]|uniref:DUF4259 domain-containing protein n=1 Tax=Nocardiopsis sp. YSL2 TaxID=2939492 RepID=UPI0026F464DF|nr:DUF4259 domain-containing protein [Nocardiopsis sp. YSL2]